MRSSPLEMKNQQSILSISEPSYSGISDNHIIDPVTSQTKWILSSCNKVQISFHMCTLHTAVKHSPAFSIFHFAPSMKRKRCRRSSRSHASYRYTAVITEYTRNICHRRCIIIAVSTMMAKHISRIRRQIFRFRRTICHSEIRISLQCPVAGFETFRPAVSCF